MSSHRVLVAFASEQGSTAGIARDLARELRGEGIEVDCLPAGEVRDVSPYQGVVLGSGVFLLRRASDGQGCLPRHAVALRDRRLWLFAAGPLGRTAPRLQHEPLGASTARQADAESPLVQVARRVGAEGTAIFGTSRAETFGPGESRMRERERVRGWARATLVPVGDAEDALTGAPLGTTPDGPRSWVAAWPAGRPGLVHPGAPADPAAPSRRRRGRRPSRRRMAGRYGPTR